MQSPKDILISKHISLTNPYPPNDLITNYKSFLKHQKHLTSYQYNNHVFTSICNLLLESIHTTEKRSVITIIERLFQYSFRYKNNPLVRFNFNLSPEEIISAENSLIIATAFIKLTEKKIPQITSKQYELAFKKLLNFIPHIQLNQDQTKYLIHLATSNSQIYQNLMRQIYPNSEITNWVLSNFNLEFNYIYRFLSLSWIIDKDHTYCISHDVMYNDFNLCNDRDQKMIVEYMQDVQLQKAVNKELEGIFRKEKSSYDHFLNEPFYPYEDLFSKQITKRFYKVPVAKNNTINLNIPDYPLMSKQFAQDIDKNINGIMMWAIAYSRIEKNLKINLIKQYYREDLLNTYINIAGRFNLPEILLID